MGRKIVFIIILLTASGCAQFELYIKNEARGYKPSVVLISPFEMRNMNYDPYVSDEFMEALKFEFFRRGYNPVIVEKKDAAVADEHDWAAKLCSSRAGDILICGVISQRETGYLADRKNSTLVSFVIYSKKGEVIGEGFYHNNESAGDESFRREASEKFVTELVENLEQVK